MADLPTTEPGCYTEHGVSGYGVAVKLSRSATADEIELKTMAEDMMMAIAQKCMNRGARCIGHIKSHVRTENGTLKADTIGTSHGAYSTGTLSGPVHHAFMAVNSIVQGVHQDIVREATLEGIHEVAEARRFDVEKEKEHAYFDEFDFTTSKEEYRKQLEEQLAELEAEAQAE